MYAVLKILTSRIFHINKFESVCTVSIDNHGYGCPVVLGVRGLLLGLAVVLVAANLPVRVMITSQFGNNNSNSRTLTREYQGNLGNGCGIHNINDLGIHSVYSSRVCYQSAHT